jgi:Rrf2 family protein
MHLSRASSYALHALAILTTRKNGQLMPSHLIAEAAGIPERFLLKVLNPLVRAGILRSVKGPNGGYSLARPAGSITLLEVVEGVDGPIRGQVPPPEGKADPGLSRRVHAACQRVADQTRKQLGRVTVADLAAKSR